MSRTTNRLDAGSFSREATISNCQETFPCALNELALQQQFYVTVKELLSTHSFVSINKIRSELVLDLLSFVEEASVPRQTSQKQNASHCKPDRGLLLSRDTVP